MMNEPTLAVLWLSYAPQMLRTFTGREVKCRGGSLERNMAARKFSRIVFHHGCSIWSVSGRKSKPARSERRGTYAWFDIGVTWFGPSNVMRGSLTDSHL